MIGPGAGQSCAPPVGGPTGTLRSLNDALISSYQLTNSTKGERPAESLTLTFTSLKVITK